MNTDERLAALEQRVGALVEALSTWFAPGGAHVSDLRARLAALRSPGMGSDVDVQRDRADRLAVLVDGLRGTLERTRAEIETLRAKLAEAEAKADFQHSMKMATQLDNGRHILQGAGVDMYSKSLEAGIRELAEKRGAYVSAKLFDDHAAAARERDALRAHALKLDGLCERLTRWVTSWRDARETPAEDSRTILDALRARGEVPR